jgi:peptidoglycan/LPS O-acetylase OafA/YrhL
MGNQKQSGVLPSWGRRMLGIEGLRALAALAILVGHVQGKLAPELFDGAAGRIASWSSQGLTLFFALSGFLLFRPFAAALITNAPLPNVKRYFENRLLRIFPVYIVIVIIVSWVVGVANTQAPTIGDSDFSRTDESVGYQRDPIKFVASLSMLQTFFPYTNRTGLGVAWSLSVELVFYLLLPLLAFVAMKLTARKANGLISALVPALVLLAIGVVGKCWAEWIAGVTPKEDHFGMEWGDNWYSVINRSIFVHGDLFAYGMFAAVVIALAQSKRMSMRAVHSARAVSVVVGIVFVVVAASGKAPTLTTSFFGVGAGALLVFVCLPNQKGHHGLLANALELRPLKYVGLVSYSLYLWHVPVIWMLWRYDFVLPATPFGFLGNVAIVLVVTLSLSAISYHFIEAQALKFKKRTGPKNSFDLTNSSDPLASDGTKVGTTG